MHNQKSYQIIGQQIQCKPTKRCQLLKYAQKWQRIDDACYEYVAVGAAFGGGCDHTSKLIPKNIKKQWWVQIEINGLKQWRMNFSKRSSMEYSRFADAKDAIFEGRKSSQISCYKSRNQSTGWNRLVCNIFKKPNKWFKQTALSKVKLTPAYLLYGEMKAYWCGTHGWTTVLLHHPALSKDKKTWW